MAMTVLVVGASVVIPIGRAIARRIAGGSGDPDARREVDALRDEVAELRDRTEQMRQELTEAHERLDFTERVLAQARAKGALPAGGA